MTESANRAVDLHRAGLVKRWHTWPTLTVQPLSAHSHGVAMLLWQILPNCRAEVLMAALTHDLHEVVTGDVPSPSKAANQDLHAGLDKAERLWNTTYDCDFGITGHEYACLWFCDRFDAALYALHELKLGNTFMHDSLEYVRKAIVRDGFPTELARNMFMAFFEDYDKQYRSNK